MTTTLDTTATHVAALHANEAARRIREAYTNAGSAVFYAPSGHGQPATLFTLYDAVGVDIWARSDEHSDQLLRVDVISARLADAHRQTPGFFPPAFPAGGALRLDITAALQPVEDAGVDGLVDLARSLDLDWLNVGEVLHDVAGEWASQRYNAGDLQDVMGDEAASRFLHDMASDEAAEANNGGVRAQAEFLIAKVGEPAARRALFDAAADQLI